MQSQTLHVKDASGLKKEISTRRPVAASDAITHNLLRLLILSVFGIVILQIATIVTIVIVR